MEQNRGVALILALLVLSFLTVLGGALLTTSTIDIWISDNYKGATQSLYLAEAGIDHGRELLRTSGHSATELLNTAAGLDRGLLTGDDQPLIGSRELMDAFGRSSGRYEVWLRNDNSDGVASLADTNEVLTLVSLGQIGSSRKTIEATVKKGRFPDTDADPRLKSVAGLESLAASVARNATDVYTTAAIRDYGSAGRYGVAVVEGNLDLGPGTGYGLLLVRGELNIVGTMSWNGLILVIGQGVLRWGAGVSGTINGGLFAARTRAVDGSLLVTPADVAYNITDPAQIKAANQSFPYNTIAIKER